MLPIEPHLPALVAALTQRPNAVLVASPGAGKTTRAPLALLDAPWAQGAKIILLSPRRITARAAAAQLARQLQEPVGETVGYRVRLEAKTSRRTRLEVVTEGVFTTMIQADPSLEGVACVIFDEFHERHLEGDLGLALALDAQDALRPDLRLLVMSATLDANAVSALMGADSSLQVEGRLFPVAHHYVGRQPHRPLEEAVTEAVLRAVREERGDCLVFLPGAREIERVRTRLEARLPASSFVVAPLYGALDPRTQDAALAPCADGRRKVVLSTSIAETSLTIEGVRIVVDSGLTRKPRFEPGAGLTRLETVRVSQAAATQRAGRAGRLEPGVCYRLWDAGETRSLPAFDTPEILEADLSSLALDLAQWGSAPETLRWLDPPPKAAWSAAVSHLQSLAGLDANARLTVHGRLLGRLPLPPRLANMVLRATEKGRGVLAAHLAVLLTEQGLGGRDVDLAVRLERWRQDSGQRAQAARGLAQRLARAADANDPLSTHGIGAVLALAYPERIAKARGAVGEALMANGRAVAFDPLDALAKSPWTVIADVAGEAQRARVLAAAALDADDIDRVVSPRVTRAAHIRFDEAAGAMRARVIDRLDAITVAERPESASCGPGLAQAWAETIAIHGLELLPGAGTLAALCHRVAFLQSIGDASLPTVSLDDLTSEFSAWAADIAMEALSVSDFDAQRVLQAVLQTWTHSQRETLQRLAPTHFETPLGSRLAIDYANPGGPLVEVRLQELFGLKAHPTIAGGRAPLVLALLSPAHRPVQVTRDLPGFWAGSYKQVRTEMKGRYPKHPWPDDPANAVPTRKAKPSQ